MPGQFLSDLIRKLVPEIAAKSGAAAKKMVEKWLNSNPQATAQARKVAHHLQGIQFSDSELVKFLSKSAGSTTEQTILKTGLLLPAVVFLIDRHNSRGAMSDLRTRIEEAKKEIKKTKQRIIQMESYASNIPVAMTNMKEELMLELNNEHAYFDALHYAHEKEVEALQLEVEALAEALYKKDE